MNGMTLKQFQDQVSELLLRHRSLLDVLSKIQQSNSSVNRSVIKAITECGCVEVTASKQPYSPDMSLEEARQIIGTHMEGKPCENCNEVISSELGRHLFYLSALSNLLDVNLEQVVEKESNRCTTLGFFTLT
jgi:hypothetical protein